MRTVLVNHSGLCRHPDTGALARAAIGGPMADHSLHEPGPHSALPWLSAAHRDRAFRLLADDASGDPEVRRGLGRLVLAASAEGLTAPVVEFPSCHAVLLDPAVPTVGLHSGRMGLKSWSAARLALTVAASGRDVLVVREFQVSIKQSSHKTIAGQVALLGLEGFDVLRDEIRHSSGGAISFRGLQDPDGIRSAEGLALIVVEEAHSVSQSSIDVLMPTLRRNVGSRMVFSWNRMSLEDPVDAMFLGPSPTGVAVESGWRQNPWLPVSALEAIAEFRERRHDQFPHVYDGEPDVRTDALVFPRGSWRVADLDDEVPDGALVLYGSDYGSTSTDPCVLSKLLQWDDVLYVREEAVGYDMTVDMHMGLFFGSDDRWGNPRDYPGIEGAKHATIVGDSAAKAWIDHALSRGVRMRSSRKGAGSIRAGIDRLRSYDIVVHPSCDNAIHELRTHSHEVDRKTGAVRPGFVDANNHSIDTWRYATEDRGAR